MDTPVVIIEAILATETSSTLGPFGVVPGRVRRGRDGERGAMQIRYAAFKDVARPGDSFARLDWDHNYSVDIANRYLLKLYMRFHCWDKAVMAYNAGPSNLNAGKPYLRKIKEHVRRTNSD